MTAGPKNEKMLKSKATLSERIEVVETNQVLLNNDMKGIADAHNLLGKSHGELVKSYNELFDSVGKMSLLMSGIVEELGEDVVNTATGRWAAKAEFAREESLKKQVADAVEKGAITPETVVTDKSFVVVSQTNRDGMVRREQTWVNECNQSVIDTIVGVNVGERAGLDGVVWEVLESYALVTPPTDHVAALPAPTA